MQIKETVSEAVANGKERGQEIIEDHPTAVAGAITAVGAAISVAATVGLWKYFRNDTKKMYGEILRENVLLHRSIS